MWTLREVSVVAAEPAQVSGFLTGMDAGSYMRWHPQDHLAFRRLRPARDATGVGQVVYFKERIGRRTYGFSCRITRAEPGRYVEFRLRRPLDVLRLGRGYFVLGEHGEASTEMEAVVELGWRLPLVGRLLDGVIARVVDMAALRAHMRDEGVNLAAALRPG